MLLRQLAICVLLSLSSQVLYAEQKELDPWRGFNEKSHAFNEFFDRNLLKPVAKGYKFITPESLNKGITNVFNNLGEPVNFVNDLLQGKPKESLVDLGRFGVNSTFGILGLFDVATRIEWYRNTEDLGQTLAVWGVPSGPYIVIPLLGPSTVRDGLVKIPESFTNLNPIYWSDPHFDLVVGTTVLDIIDSRADLLETEKLLFGNRYQAMRDFYLQLREFDIKDGQVEDDFMSEVDDW
jgi:phospholipid-binding lipoprotein MlaA